MARPRPLPYAGAMTIPAKQGLDALTEKEKATLRMIVRGHDAKSIARALDLSVHTINERLREARRKVAVSSSREAARLLFEAEDLVAASRRESFGDKEIGDATARPSPDGNAASIPGAGRHRRPWLTIGVVLMLPALALLAFVALPQVDAPSPPPPATTVDVSDPAVVDTARNFLMLIDDKRWNASYAATGAAIRKANTLKVWTAASEQARASLGAVVTRTLLSAESVPAPQHDLTLVKFRTQFANQTVIETVTLDRESGAWRVAGITIG